VLTLTPQQIYDTPWTPVTGCEGVSVKELWRSADLVYVLLRYVPDAATSGLPHTVDQHLWVVDGEATVVDRRLPAGSYVHVPAGTPHPIRATGALGCVILQSHTRVTADIFGTIIAASCQQ